MPVCKWHSVRCQYYVRGECTRPAETWKDRIARYEASDREPGDIRLHIPEDIDALINDWRLLGGK